MRQGEAPLNRGIPSPLNKDIIWQDFDKFTNRAKQVIKLAKKEAQRLNHNYLGTEHVLLGLFKLGQGIAVNVLRNFNIDYETVRAK